MFVDTGKVREGYLVNDTYTPSTQSEERVTSDETIFEDSYKERKTPESYKALQNAFVANGIFYPATPEEFTVFMQDIASKTISTFPDGTRGDHYRLTRWIQNNQAKKGKCVHNIFELLAAHANSSPYSIGEVTSTMVKALSKIADELLVDPNLHYNCKFDKTQIVTMLMLSMIRCHCAVLYFDTLVKDASKAPDGWYTVTIKTSVQSVPVGGGRYERRTVYRHVIRK